MTPSAASASLGDTRGLGLSRTNPDREIPFDTTNGRSPDLPEADHMHLVSGETIVAARCSLSTVHDTITASLSQFLRLDAS